MEEVDLEAAQRLIQRDPVVVISCLASSDIACVRQPELQVFEKPAVRGKARAPDWLPQHSQRE